MKMNELASVMAVTIVVSAVQAEVFYDAGPGSGASSGMLGGHTLTSFPLDEHPLFEDVTSVPSPLGGELGFSIPLNHRRVGQGWWTDWSHGYTGDVYFTNFQTSVILTMPPDTVAFEFYVQPNPGLLHTFTAVTDDGTSSGAYTAAGFGGATYAGFYGTDGSTISSIEITGSANFALGEFAIVVVPEPAVLTPQVVAGLAMVRRRGALPRRRRLF